MKYIYLPMRGTWKYMLHANLEYERIAKYLVRIKRIHGDVPFWKHFYANICRKTEYYFHWQARWIDYQNNILAGFEEYVYWKKTHDGMYVPYDEVGMCEVLPLKRKTPPEGAIVR